MKNKFNILGKVLPICIALLTTAGLAADGLRDRFDGQLADTKPGAGGNETSPQANIGASSGFYTNPVCADLMPDPSVIRYGDFYYAAGTTGDKRTSDGRIFTLLKSRDLVHWEKLNGA